MRLKTCDEIHRPPNGHPRATAGGTRNSLRPTEPRDHQIPPGVGVEGFFKTGATPPLRRGSLTSAETACYDRHDPRTWLPKRQEIKFVSIEDLRLDPKNPRLPEGAEKWSQHQILVHLKTTAALDELAYSLVSEGFFINEPLTVLPDSRLKGFVALEGNRRVATLMILTGQAAAEDEKFFDIEPTTAQRKRLAEIPCIEVADREAVDSFVGFRHIGGLKTWSPEAKARWIVTEVEKESRIANVENPFLAVGRRVGLSSPPIRASFMALQVLRIARDEGGVKDR